VQGADAPSLLSEPGVLRPAPSPVTNPGEKRSLRALRRVLRRGGTCAVPKRCADDQFQQTEVTMRPIIVAAFAAVALFAGAGHAVSQTKTDEAKSTGQSERPASKKQIEPESQSHNADKPKGTTQTLPEDEKTKK
jgi:hypothetical protein